MSRGFQKLVCLLTVLAFLFPQIASATEIELVEVHEIASVVKIQRDAFIPVMKMHAVLDQEIYPLNGSDRSGAKDSSFVPVIGHRHCSFSLAGCMALTNASDLIVVIPVEDCRVRSTQQSLVGITPEFTLPPPKHHLRGVA